MGLRTKYIATETAALFLSNGEKLILLWGDRVKVDFDITDNNNIHCRARGYRGFISPDSVGDESLLEIYVIDVGQGDGVLVKCPDPNKRKLGRHLMIDGGYIRSKQPHKKNAADFVDWKFFRDYGLNKITIDDMVVSHCDADHYGGLWDLVNEEEEIRKEIDCDEVEVKNFYHAGVTWWRLADGADRSLGRELNDMLIDILTDRDSMERNLDKSVFPHIQGEYGDFLKAFTESQPNAHIEFVGHESGSNEDVYLKGYEKDLSDVSIEVLGPIFKKDLQNQIQINDLGSNSINTNGNSIVFSLVYNKFRMLLTGDLNKKSQQLLMQEHHPSKFSCDVSKACHHGSDDVSFTFLQLVNAAATIISSGDNEKHAHPKANLLSMSALSGYRVDGNDTLISPLIFSTEIARSVRIGIPQSAKINNPADNDPDNDIEVTNMDNLIFNYERGDAGDLNPERKSKKMSGLSLIDGIVYGLVNIRTDGNKILFAIRKEKGKGWETSTLFSRFP